MAWLATSPASEEQMSKLTDKIDALIQETDCILYASQSHALRTILADVRELEQELRLASRNYESAIDVLHSPDELRAAKREAYAHARTLFCSHQRMRDGLTALNKAIDALDAEKGK
jgi:hypothetical protein